MRVFQYFSSAFGLRETCALNCVVTDQRQNKELKDAKMLHKAAGSGPTCNKEHSILLLIQPDRIYWCSCIKFPQHDQQIHTQRGSVCMCEVIRKVTVPPLS